MSRSPVREAVVRLTWDRPAVDEPRRGAVVASVDLQELAELYEVREALEGVAARLAVRRAGPALAAELERITRGHEQEVTHTGGDQGRLRRRQGTGRGAGAQPEPGSGA